MGVTIDTARAVATGTVATLTHSIEELGCLMRAHPSGENAISRQPAVYLQLMASELKVAGCI